MSPRPTTLDPRAPVKQIRLLAGRPYEKLAASCGYATGGSLTRAEGRGGSVDVSTVRRVAAGAGVRRPLEHDHGRALALDAAAPGRVHAQRNRPLAAGGP